GGAHQFCAYRGAANPPHGTGGADPSPRLPFRRFPWGNGNPVSSRPAVAVGGRAPMGRDNPFLECARYTGEPTTGGARFLSAPGDPKPLKGLPAAMLRNKEARPR